MLNRIIQINNKTVTLEQDLSVSHAGTVWDGALVLAYYLEKNINITKLYFQNKRVLQLGSGTGAVGLTVALFKPKHLYLTDFEQFLPILRKNTKSNEHNWEGNETIVQVMSLKWGLKEDMQKIKEIDTIIGSQLAYDAQNINYLIQTLLYYVNRNKNILIMISYQKYTNPDRNLYERLKKVKQLQCQEVSATDMNPDYIDEGIGILQIQASKK